MWRYQLQAEKRERLCESVGDGISGSGAQIEELRSLSRAVGRAPRGLQR